MATCSPDLERIHVRHATFRDHSQDARAAAATRLAAHSTDEHVLVQTCHRVELVSVDRAEVPEQAGVAGMVSGRSAVRRVFEVVAGFDSAIVAEEQLIGQVRTAFEAALAAGTAGPILGELFRRALRFGRRVRSHARPGMDRSLADRGVAWLTGHVDSDVPVLVAGTGEMGRRAARLLATRGHPITLVSSSADRGAAASRQLGGLEHRVVIGRPNEELLAGHGAIVIAVRGTDPVIGRREVLAARRPWTLDLSQPPAVAADAVALLGHRFRNVDHLGATGPDERTFGPGVERRLRRDLEHEVDGFVAWLDERRSGDAVSLLRRNAEAVRRRHLDRLRRRTPLDPVQLAAVEAASAAMLGDLLHRPSVELRRGGADAGTVRRLFGLDG